MTTKRQAKRERILDAAAVLFSERGYANTRMADIASAVDMKAGSLYYYFDSKEAVLAAVVGDRVGSAVTTLEQVISGDETPVDKIRAAIAGHLEVFDRQSELYSIFIGERFESINSDLAARVDDLGRRYEELWTTLIADAQRAGAIRANIEPWLTMKAIVGMCNSTLFWYDGTGRLSPDDVAASFGELVIGGLMGD